jgi:hypothetical protein
MVAVAIDASAAIAASVIRGRWPSCVSVAVAVTRQRHLAVPMAVAVPVAVA